VCPVGRCSLGIEMSALGRHGASAVRCRRKDADPDNKVRQQMFVVS